MLWACRALAVASVEHGSATVAFEQYQPLLRKAHWLLCQHGDVILADRGFSRLIRIFLPPPP
ncbi:hypothetical protein [Leptothermofonsia sichuanensis]|uniref:hypothetical protein n=1 Tax=Leptothermofonsia sichuanensis TaxID=2917832 RepID=UPI001CEC3165|nr:hypothetical protein [Leptothermofonsia sichuanensis]